MADKGAPLYIKFVVIVIVIIVSFIAIRKQKAKNSELEIRHRYTIGVTKGSSFNHRSSTYGLNYSFLANGRKYVGFISVSSLSGIKTNEGKYIVIFDPGNPQNNKLLLDKPVIFHPAVIEDSGWIIIPDEILHYKDGRTKKE